MYDASSIVASGYRKDHKNTGYLHTKEYLGSRRETRRRNLQV